MIYIKAADLAKSLGKIILTCFILMPIKGYADDISQTIVDVKDVQLAADFNRDGKIEFGQELTKNGARTDFNTEDKPYVFWVNDDNDDPSSETKGLDVAVYSMSEYDDSQPDFNNYIIDGSRDLIDFFAVSIDLHKYLTTTQDVEKQTFWLQHDDEAVNVVFTAMNRGITEGAGLSSDYLKKITMGNVSPIFGDWQTHGSLGGVSVRTVFDNGTEIPKEFIELIKNDENKGVILVEGNHETIKPLKIIIKDENKNQLVFAELPLRIYNVTRLYRQVSLRDDLNSVARDEVSKIWGESPTGEIPNVTTLLNDLSSQATSIKLKTPEININNHVIYLHGSLIDEIAASEFQSETFKRLYHSGSNALFTGVHWRGDEGIPAGLNYWDNVENAFYSADDLAALVNGIVGAKNIIAHSLANVMAGSAIQDFSMGFNKYFMMNPAVALEAYKSTINAKEMRNIDWDKYYFGPVADDISYNDQSGRRLWSVEWHTLFNNMPDARKTLTWRDRFSAVGSSENVVQYYSTGDEVLQKATAGDPNDGSVFTEFGRNAWNVQEKGKGTGEPVAILGSLFDPITAGWGFNKTCETDPITSEELCFNNGLLLHTDAQPFFDAAREELIKKPFFAPFNNTLLNDLNAGAAAVAISYPHILAYEMPAFSFAAGGTKIASFPKNRSINMNIDMADGWPAIRGGEWHHSDFKDIAYRYTYPLFNDIVERGALK